MGASATPRIGCDPTQETPDFSKSEGSLAFRQLEKVTKGVDNAANCSFLQATDP